ncbi:hypothetical protein EGR_03769 [Echinococcus granulosus]|uniref:Protein kinase domain-containing protein n=1 Tax=Echinococcus granulosus TaxID=6210 RepID=W6UJQ8_ECHGR|nr:hypothetical protein EGR_03769 [Echinococcus granulosus]EUB61283.1 hypothetical protein EGR_03769 [Echinococcus granulosus]
MYCVPYLANGSDCLRSLDVPTIRGSLKPSNILFLDGCTTLEMSDMGKSKVFESNMREMQLSNQRPLFSTAPEERYDEICTRWSRKVDIYSVVVTAWEKLTRKLDEEVHSYLPFQKSRGQRPSASHLIRPLNSFMRNVCTKSTSQLYIAFENAELSSISPNARDFSVSERECWKARGDVVARVKQMSRHRYVGVAGLWRDMGNVSVLDVNGQLRGILRADFAHDEIEESNQFCGLVEGDATYIDVFRRCQEDCIGFSTLAGGGDTLQEVKDGFDYCKKSSIKNCGLSHF